MATLDDVDRLAGAPPGVVEGDRRGARTWSAGPCCFAGERPLSKADISRVGDEPVPAGDILAVSVADLDEKDAVIAAHPGSCFTIPHFAGYPAVLVQLVAVDEDALAATLTDGWRTCTPPPGPGG